MEFVFCFMIWCFGWYVDCLRCCRFGFGKLSGCGCLDAWWASLIVWIGGLLRGCVVWGSVCGFDCLLWHGFGLVWVGGFVFVVCPVCGVLTAEGWCLVGWWVWLIVFCVALRYLLLLWFVFVIPGVTGLWFCLRLCLAFVMH